MDDEIAALVPRYLNSRREESRQLPKLLSGGDFASIRRIAHNLKGTGASYGFPGLTALGQAMQMSAESSDTDALVRQIHELADSLEKMSGQYQHRYKPIGW